MNKNTPVNLFWFRRDLRLDDNHGLYKALTAGNPVITIYIFDKNRTSDFAKDDIRHSFIYNRIEELNESLKPYNHTIHILYDTPVEAFTKIAQEYSIKTVFANEEYEPYGIERDAKISDYLSSQNINFQLYTDQVILHPNQALKSDNKPYTVFTPFSKKWLSVLDSQEISFYNSEESLSNLSKEPHLKIPLSPFDFTINKASRLNIRYPAEIKLRDYESKRDFPAMDATTKVSTLLRYGLISIRRLYKMSYNHSFVYAKELIWREFYASILFHFPHITTQSFKKQYDALPWILNEEHFERWCEGKTGYPIVDAGMRELNETGFMHNRLRMITASFLTKHLLIDWRWGESYFANKLHDYDQASNVGGWQWAASTGNDAVPYFRIFNPSLQSIRFDKNNEYTRRWVPEFETKRYPKPVVEHSFARLRAIDTYRNVTNNDQSR
ncbi:MAG: deoxyribodipyrimidine photo-lyase [Salinivirgaceae bacterium]|nr:deoxyribodipyrimidine photo-lyase [Salinivirgaceae bacterium]